MGSILQPNSSLLAHENCKGKKTLCHSLLFVTSRTLTAGRLIYIGILIYRPLCMKNKGNFKSLLQINKKERKRGGEEGSEKICICCLPFYNTQEKRDKSQFPSCQCARYYRKSKVSDDRRGRSLILPYSKCKGYLSLREISSSYFHCNIHEIQ